MKLVIRLSLATNNSIDSLEGRQPQELLDIAQEVARYYGKK